MVAITPPKPGQAVLVCRCGHMLDLAQMRRLRLPGRLVQAIACAACADRGWRR